MNGSRPGSTEGIEGLEDALENMRAVDHARRAAMTFEALDALARILDGVPGRKNLIWFAGSFPVAIFPTPEEARHLVKTSGDYLEQLKKTTDLLALARVAVYPVSAEGMMAERVAEADAGGAGGALGAGHQGARGNAMAPYSQGAAERAKAVTAMEWVAESTGGRAFYNTNDFGKVIRQTVDDGSNYYTIGYSPTDKNMDGSYRRIEVRVKERGLHLAYRRGYYAANESERP